MPGIYIIAMHWASAAIVLKFNGETTMPGIYRTLADPKGQVCIYIYIYITSPKGQQKFEDSHFTPQSKGYYE